MSLDEPTGPGSPQPAQFPPDKERTGLVTLLFTDIVDSTALKQHLGDQGGAALFRKHHQLVRELLSHFPTGQEIETAGDSFLIIFSIPSDSVRFALLLQSKLSRLREQAGIRLFDRIAIHVGEVVVQAGQSASKPRELYGIQIDTCSRVLSLAKGGQILMSRGAFDSARQVLKGEDIQGLGQLAWLNHGPYLLKGLDDAVEICEVREAGKEAQGPPISSEKAQRKVLPDEESVLGWRPALAQPLPHRPWVLEKKLGEGGFGEVWLGRNATTKQTRVFKFCFQTDRVRFLKRELTLFRLLKERVGDHPNIVGIHDVNLGTPPFYVEMDYVEGADLRTWYEGFADSGAIPLETRLEIVAQAADGLQAAHEAGIIHRDIKPANILIGGKGVASGDLRVKLTDFGIGQVVSEEYLNGITRAGFTQTVVKDSSSSRTGTQLYMAPELLAGRPASTRSDIYSLGVVLYQLLLADFRRPLTMDWENEVSDPLLRDDLKHCFAGNPQDRFAAAGQLAKNLRTLAQRQARLVADRAEIAARERAAYRRGIVRAAGVALVIVAGVVLLALFAFSQSRAATNGQRILRRHLYAAQMNVVLQAWQDGYIARARELLNQQRPKDGEEDFRGFEWRYFWSICQDESLATIRNDNGIQCLALSPDGKTIATGDFNDFVRLWDTRSRQKVGQFRLDAEARSLAFSRDGQLLATGSDSGAVALQRVATREWLTLTRHSNRVEQVAFSPNGKWLASASIDGLVKLCNLTTREEIVSLQFLPNSRFSVAFSPDSQMLALADGDQTVKLVDTASRGTVGVLRGHVGQVVRVVFSPDGKLVASASADATAKLWDVASRRERGTLAGHKGWVHSVNFSPDGKLLATTCIDGTIKLWDSATTLELKTLKGHSAWVGEAVFCPDGKTLISGSDDYTIKFWDTNLRSDSGILGGRTNIVLFQIISPDGATMATTDPKGNLRLWNVASQKEIPFAAGQTGLGRCAAFSSDGKILAAGQKDGKVKFWNLATQVQVAAFQAHSNDVEGVSWSSDDRVVLTRSGNELAIWDLNSQRRLTELRAQQQLLWLARLSSDGRRLIWFDGNGQLTLQKQAGRINLWDIPAARQQRIGPAPGDLINRQEASADGRLIAYSTVSESNVVKVFDLAARKDVTQFPALVGGTTDQGLAFSLDNKMVAVADEDSTLKLWDLSSNRELKQFRGHTGQASGIAFSADGKTLASVGQDGTVKLWSLAVLELVATLPGYASPHSRIFFLPSGNGLYTYGEDQLVHFWLVPPVAEKEKVSVSGSVPSIEVVLTPLRCPATVYSCYCDLNR